MRSFGIDCQGGKGNAGYTINVAPTLGAISHGTPHAVCYQKTNSITRDTTSAIKDTTK